MAAGVAADGAGRNGVIGACGGNVGGVAIAATTASGPTLGACPGNTMSSTTTVSRRGGSHLRSRSTGHKRATLGCGRPTRCGCDPWGPDDRPLPNQQRTRAHRHQRVCDLSRRRCAGRSGTHVELFGGSSKVIFATTSRHRPKVCPIAWSGYTATVCSVTSRYASRADLGRVTNRRRAAPEPGLAKPDVVADAIRFGSVRSWSDLARLD
jgi:hypothetical protein